MIASETAPSTASTPTYPTRRVYSVVGVPPEVQAYALAKYSRSGQGMLESIQELSQQKAEQFLNTFYFEYGHRSIADLAHLVFGLEQISILAAIAVVDEQIWDGQERSTRYQPFRKTGWHLPHEVAGTAAEATFARTAEGLLAAYMGLTSSLVDHLVEVVPRPDDMADGAFRRTLRARAFDVARALLPLATHTSVGQVVSARTLERQIARLLGSPYAEVRAAADDLRAACQLPAEAPLLGRLLAETSDPELRELLRPRAAPTLVKYAERSAYPTQAAAALTQAARELLADAGTPDTSHVVELAPPTPALAEMAATLLYRHDPGGRSYRQVLSVVGDLPEARQQEIFDLSLADRGRHDGWLREHQAGYAFIFDVLVDLGSFRDLHRHRRCVQVQQAFTWAHGFQAVEDVFEAGLGGRAANAALEAGLGDVYTDCLVKAEQAGAEVARVAPLAADYLLPLAYRTRCLFKMDWAQVAYMVEQRTTPQGHFSYRRVAWEMYAALRDRSPALAAPIRAIDPYGPPDLLRR